MCAHYDTCHDNIEYCLMSDSLLIIDAGVKLFWIGWFPIEQELYNTSMAMFCWTKDP